jgi:multimeric flavodoxin WrbA
MSVQKVLLVNGSPHAEGCTFTALSEAAKTLREGGIETEFLQLGTDPIRGCTACGACWKGPDRCVFDDDIVNRALEKAEGVDGFIFGSPVHYASAGGSITAFLDRFFYAGPSFAGKPGAVVVSCRRGGGTASFDQLNKYLTISGMPVVSSQYWNCVHGNTPDEVRQDAEGLQIMRTLGRNMAWLLKCIEAGRAAGIEFPPAEPRKATNFIR